MKKGIGGKDLLSYPGYGICGNLWRFMAKSGLFCLYFGDIEQACPVF